MTRWLAILMVLGTLNSSATSIEESWQLYHIREFNSAIRGFENIHKTAEPGSESRLMALYGEAHCWNYHQTDRRPEKARALYEQLLAEAPPGHPLMSWSALEIAQSFHLSEPVEGRDLSKVIEYYQQVYERYPNSAAGQEARVASFYLEASMPETSNAALIEQVEAFIKRNPGTPWQWRCHSIMAKAYGKLGDYQKQVDQLILITKVDRIQTQGRSVDNSTAYWSIAYCAEFELGDFTIAREYCDRFLKEYPRDNRAFAVKQALERMNKLQSELEQGQATFPPNRKL